MKKLAALIALFCFSAALVPAATIYVNKTVTPDATHFNTVAAGIAAAGSGDTIEITDSEVYLEANLNLTQKNLTCSATPPATIEATVQYDAVLNLNWNCNVSNVILKGNDAYHGVINVNGGVTNLTNVVAMDLPHNREIVWVSADKSATGNYTKLTAEGCYFIGGPITFEGNGKIADVANPNDTAVFNHCTIMSHNVTNFKLANWVTDGQGIEIKNSIVGSYDGTPAAIFWGIRTFESDTANMEINHHHNLYTGYWQFIYRAATDNGSGVPDAAKGELAKNYNEGANGDTVWNVFRDVANLDFRLGGDGAFGNWVPGGNPAVGKADDGTNIGADLLTVPVELSNFSAE